MKRIERIEAYTKRIDKPIEAVTFFCLIVSVTFAIFNVIARYFFDISFAIVEEICRYTIIYGAFLYLGPLVKRNEHIKMDLMDHLLKGKVKLFNQFIISIILFASFVFLSFTASKWVLSLYELKIMTSSASMLMYIPALAVPIGMILGSIYSFQQIILDITKLRLYKTIQISEQHTEQNMA